MTTSLLHASFSEKMSNTPQFNKLLKQPRCHAGSSCTLTNYSGRFASARCSCHMQSDPWHLPAGLVEPHFQPRTDMWVCTPPWPDGRQALASLSRTTANGGGNSLKDKKSLLMETAENGGASPLVDDGQSCALSLAASDERLAWPGAPQAGPYCGTR